MTETMTSEELVAEAEHARRLLNDTLLKETLAELEVGYIEDFRQGDIPEGQSLYWQLRAVDDLRKELRAKMDRGTVEQRFADRLARS